MSVSLTSAGLYLEPRVYVNAGSGNNYGTPRVVSSYGTSLGGSWSGIYNIMGDNLGGLAMLAESGVSSSSGGGFTSEYPNSISRKGKGGGLNGYVYRWFWNKVLLLYCRLHKNIKPSYRSYKSNTDYQNRYSSSTEWRSLLSEYFKQLHLFHSNSQNLHLSQHCDDLLPTFLNLHLVKEVA